MADPTNVKIKVPLKLGGLLGFLGGFMFAYQRSSSECHCRDLSEICKFLCAQCDSGAGPKTNVRQKWIYKNFGNARRKAYLCTAHHLNQIGYNRLLTGILNGHNSNFVRISYIVCYLLLIRFFYNQLSFLCEPFRRICDLPLMVFIYPGLIL